MTFNKSLFAGLIGLAFFCNVYGQSSEHIRPEIGSVIKKIKTLIDSNKLEDAKQEIEAGKSSKNLTGPELDQLEILSLQSSLSLKDYAKAKESLLYLSESSSLGTVDKLRYEEALIAILMRNKDYDDLISHSKKYFENGGSKDSISLIYAQANIYKENNREAVNFLEKLIASKKARQELISPAELKLLAFAQNKLKDENGYISTLEQLIEIEPKREYLVDWIDRLQFRKDWSKYSIDLLEIKKDLAGEKLSSEDQFRIIDSALKIGLPSYALKAYDDAEKDKSLDLIKGKVDLRELNNRIRRAVLDDEQLVIRNQKQINKADRTQLAEIYMSRKEWSKAVELYELSLASSDGRKSEILRLHYGVALYKLNDKDSARKNFESIKGNDPVSKMANIWKIFLDVKN